MCALLAILGAAAGCSPAALHVTETSPDCPKAQAAPLPDVGSMLRASSPAEGVPESEHATQQRSSAAPGERDAGAGEGVGAEHEHAH